MRVLVVANAVPRFPGSGASTRLYCLLRELAREATVELISLRPEDGLPPPPFLQRVDAVQPVPRTSRLPVPLRRLHSLLRRLVGPPGLILQQEGLHRPFGQLFGARLAAFRPDLVHVDMPFSLHLLRDFPEVPKMVDVYDVTWRSYLGLAARQPRLEDRCKMALEAFHCRRWEARLLGGARTCAVVSEEERAQVLSLAPRIRSFLVPNGADTDYFAPLPASAGKTLLFTGLMSYFPNVDAVRFLAEDVLPRVRREHPDCRLQVVGMQPAPEVLELGRRHDFEVVGAVPDMRPYLASAAVVLAPLRIGSGTRLKILEAMACQRAVVATRLGAEGLAVQPGRDLLVADSPDDLARSIGLLLRDDGLRARLAAAGRQLAVARYDWRQFLPALRQAYQDALVGMAPGEPCRKLP